MTVGAIGIVLIGSLVAVAGCADPSGGGDLRSEQLAVRCPGQHTVLEEQAVILNRPLPRLSVEAGAVLYATVQTDDGPIFKGYGTALSFVDAAIGPVFDDPMNPTEVRNAVATMSVLNGRYRRLGLPSGSYVISSTNAVRLRVIRC